MKFHDGTDFNADAVIWNLDRLFKTDSPQFEAAATGISRSRVPILASCRKIDDATVALTTTTAASYFPWMVPYLPNTSPASFEKGGRDWAKVAQLPPSGTGPFRIPAVVPRQSVTLAKWDGYWDSARKPKIDQVLLGKPVNKYTFDPTKGKALLAEAGFTPQKPLSFKVMISTSGSGQMLPLPMNEALQENLKQACGVEVQVQAVEWQVLLNAGRAVPGSPMPNGAMTLKVSSPSSDVGMMFRYFAAANFSPTGSNFQQWKEEKFEQARELLAGAADPAAIAKLFGEAHERLVDNPPWLYIVHDLNPRALTKNVQGFVSA